MIERHITTPPGQFSLCHCGHEPRYILILGRSLRETGTSAPTTRHALECRCGRATAKHATLQAAEAEWGPVLTQMPLVLPPSVARLTRRTRRTATASKGQTMASDRFI